MRPLNLLTTAALCFLAPISLVGAQDPSLSQLTSISTHTITRTVSHVVATETVTSSPITSPVTSSIVSPPTNQTSETTIDNSYSSGTAGTNLPLITSVVSGSATPSQNGSFVASSYSPSSTSPSDQPQATGAAPSLNDNVAVASLAGIVALVLAGLL